MSASIGTTAPGLERFVDFPFRCDTSGRMAATLSRRRGRRWLSRLLSVALTLVVGLALVAAWVRVVQTLLKAPEHKPPIGNVTSVVWDGRVFTTSAQLRAFFEARGLSYTRWAKAHPYAFTGEKPPAATRRAAATKPVVKPKPKAKAAAAAKTVTTAVPAPRSTPASTGGGFDLRPILATAVTVLLILAAVALALFATVAARFVPRLSRRMRLDPERRLTVIAASLAILFGLFIAHFMS